MAKKQSKSERIRKLLNQGKSVKQIVGMLDVTPQFVYTIRAQDKKKAEKDWVMVETSTSKKPIGIPKDVYIAELDNIYGHTVMVTSPPKQGIFKRIANWFFGG